MTAKYRLVRNPNPNLSKEPLSLPLHPRLISCGTIHTDELIEEAKERSSFSSADIKGVLQLLQEAMADYLANGYLVDLQGIGTFSVSLKGYPAFKKEKIRSESIHFKNINFRASKVLKERLKTMVVYRDSLKGREPDIPSLYKCRQLIINHLSSHSYLTLNDYMQFCHCSRSKASLDLRKFVREGILYRKRFGTMYLYYKEKVNDFEPKFSEIIH